MELYKVSPDSPVGRLLTTLEETCERKGFELARWSAHRGRWRFTITYAILTTRGRATQFRWQPRETILASCQLGQREGSSTRSAAFVALGLLLEKARKAKRKGTKTNDDE